jgi:hypothetical protein
MDSSHSIWRISELQMQAEALDGQQVHVIIGTTRRVLYLLHAIAHCVASLAMAIACAPFIYLIVHAGPWSSCQLDKIWLPSLLRLRVVWGVVMLFRLGCGSVDGRAREGGGSGHLLMTIDGLNGTIPVFLKDERMVDHLKVFIRIPWIPLRNFILSRSVQPVA